MVKSRAMQEMPDAHQDAYSKTVFGFWMYVMTDCVLFATLFATFVILEKGTFGGPSGKDLFSMPFALTETFLLLISSFTCGLAMMAAYKGAKRATLLWFGVTFLLGLGFVGMEVSEFSDFVREGNSWERSAFLSSFFTLVGTHGLHISIGLIWMFVMMVQVGVRGIKLVNLKRLACLGIFWHFLDVVWIFIFTVVYLLGSQ